MASGDSEEDKDFQELCAALDQIFSGRGCGLILSVITSVMAKQIAYNAIDALEARNHFVAELDSDIARYQRRTIPDGSLS